MKLTILCGEITPEIKENVARLAAACKTRDYELLDPKSYDIDQAKSCVLIMGPLKYNPLNYRYVWKTLLPTKELKQEEKLYVKEVFQSASVFAWENRDCSEVRWEDFDVEDPYKLNEWLKTRQGVLEIKLKDNRVVGIYPDGHSLDNKFSLEMHASHFINLFRIIKMFNGKEVRIKG